MDFRLSPEQEELQDLARRVLGEQFSTDQLREAEASADGFPRELWDAFAERGWSGLTLAEEFGGAGRGLADATVLLEEIGRAGATLPLVASSGVSATIVERAPQGVERDRLLRSIAAGAIVAPALIDEASRNEWDAPRPPLRPDGDGWRMSGTKVLVPFGAVADELLLTAGMPDGGTAIVALNTDAEGVTITPHHSKVGVPLASVALTDALVSADRVIHRGDEAREAVLAGLHVGSLLSTAEAVGMSAALTSITAEHVTQREAFGRPIATFQAVAHPCAQMRISGDVIRILVQQAAWMIDDGRNTDEEVPAAKALANELFVIVANDAFRLHGARGFSNECDVQLYMRRLQGFFSSFGETQESYERAATTLGMGARP